MCCFLGICLSSMYIRRLIISLCIITLFSLLLDMPGACPLLLIITHMTHDKKEEREKGEYFFQVQIIISNFRAVWILIISILKNTPTNICGKAYLILIHFFRCQYLVAAICMVLHNSRYTALISPPVYQKDFYFTYFYIRDGKLGIKQRLTRTRIQ